jgi:hypothetical protein
MPFYQFLCRYFNFYPRGVAQPITNHLIRGTPYSPRISGSIKKRTGLPQKLFEVDTSVSEGGLNYYAGKCNILSQGNTVAPIYICVGLGGEGKYLAELSGRRPTRVIIRRPRQGPF